MHSLNGAFSLGLLATSCVVAPSPGAHAAGPEHAALAGALTALEVATAKKNEVVLGWDMQVVGDRARFRRCSAEDTCTADLVEVPAKSVASVERIARSRPIETSGAAHDEVDVLRITLAKELETSRGGIASDPTRGLVVGGAAK